MRNCKLFQWIGFSWLRKFFIYSIAQFLLIKCFWAAQSFVFDFSIRIRQPASVWLLEQINGDICIEQRSSGPLGAENVSNTYLCILVQLVSSSKRRLLWPKPITISSLHRIKFSPSPSLSLFPEFDRLASWTRVFVYLFPVDDLLF